MKKDKAILIVAVLMLIAFGVSAVSATTVTVGSKTFTAVGENAQVLIMIDDLPNGLSGYKFNVVISDPNVATISNAVQPDWLKGQFSFVKNSATDMEVKAVDTASPECDEFGENCVEFPKGKTTNGAKDVLLCKVNIKSFQAGVSTITITSEQLDSDEPNVDAGVVTATIVPGTLTLVADADGDGIPDGTDNCPAVANADQANADGDAKGDACEECDADADKTEAGICGCGVADTDTDSDNTADCIDECDSDPLKIVPGDCGCGNVDVPGCGVCSDADTDGVCDADDNCPAVANADQADADQDGAGDACEECDADADKTVPGICGCGVADTDTDKDGVADCNDLCPVDPAKIAPGDCGCGVVDTPFCGGCSDVDSDGVCDADDNCPAVANADQADADQDGAGDACDRCPSDPAKTVPGQCGCGVAEGSCQVPEFPSMVVPAVSLIGMLAVVFLAQRKEN